MDFEGLVWRYVPRNAHALHVGFILLARGRWNRYAEYGCFYTSLSPEGARAEYAKELRRIGTDAEDDLESCRIIADIARLEGYDAILSPSAALDPGRNLNLYIDGRADHLRLMDGPDRIPLNYDA